MSLGQLKVILRENIKMQRMMLRYMQHCGKQLRFTTLQQMYFELVDEEKAIRECLEYEKTTAAKNII